MNITSNQFNPNFQGIKIVASEMNQVQRNFANDIADALGYMSEYCRASDLGVDVVFLPHGKDADKVKVLYLNTDSEMLYKFKKTCKPVSNNISASKGKFKMIDKICDTLRKITSKQYTAEDVNYNRIINGETDQARLFPGDYDAFVNSVEKFDRENPNLEAEFYIHKYAEKNARDIGIHTNIEV